MLSGDEINNNNYLMGHMIRAVSECKHDGALGRVSRIEPFFKLCGKDPF